MGMPHRSGHVDFSGPVALVLGAVTSCLLWGSAVPVVRLGYQLLGIGPEDTGSQLVFAGMRFVLAGAAVVVAISVTRGGPALPSRAEAKAAARISLFQTFGQYLLYYVGLAHSTGVSGSISQGIDVFASLLIASVAFRMERLTPQKVVGCVIGLAGILLADAGSRAAGGAGGFTLIGEGLVMLATVCSAMASVLTRRYAQDCDPMVLCGWQFVMGGASLLGCGLVLGGSVRIDSLAGAGALAWLVMVSAVAYGLWSVLLRYHDVSRVSVFTFTLPIFGVLLSLVILGDEGAVAGPVTFLALALVCVGILVVERAPEGRANT